MFIWDRIPLEIPRCTKLDAAAFLFSDPAVDAEVEGDGAAGLDLPAQLKESAGAFDTRARGCAAVVGCPGFSAKFILVGKAAVEAVLLVHFVGEPCPEAESVTVHAVEVPGFITAGASVHRDRIAALMAVEILQVAVHGVVMSDVHDLAGSEMSGEVGRGTVVVDILAIEVAVVVRGGASAPEASLVVEAVMVDLACHDADAYIVTLAVAVGAVVEIAVILAAAILYDRAEEELALAVFEFPCKAHVDAEALGVHIGAALCPEAGAAERRKGSEAGYCSCAAALAAL